MRFLLILILVLSGCSCNLDHITLESHWEPLKRIQKDGSVPEGLYQTVDGVILTRDPCEFAAQDAYSQNALLTHEQVHALHQREMGSVDFARRYANDLAFRLQEEQAGWRAQIVYLVRHGREKDIDPAFIASVFVRQYRVSTEERVIAWVNSEVATAKASYH